MIIFFSKFSFGGRGDRGGNNRSFGGNNGGRRRY